MTPAQTESVHNLLFVIKQMQDWLTKNVDKLHFPEYDSLDFYANQLRSITPPLTIYISTENQIPPKKGAYKVRCRNGSNTGYRYWNGEYWGNLCSSRSWCLQRKDTGRKSQMQTVYWANYVKP